MIEAGSKIAEHDGSATSALDIVSTLVGQNSEAVLDIVYQLVHEQKTLDETEAGKYVRTELSKVKKKLERELTELQEGMEEVTRERDEEAISAIKKERAEAEAKAAQHAKEWEDLKISMQQLAQEKQSQYRDLAINSKQRQEANGSRAESPVREKRIRDLEYALRQKEQQHKEAMARQQIEQQSQNTAQLQRIRLIVEQSTRERKDLQRQLDNERQLRMEEEVRSDPITAFFKQMAKIPKFFFGALEEPSRQSSYRMMPDHHSSHY